MWTGAVALVLAVVGLQHAASPVSGPSVLIGQEAPVAVAPSASDATDGLDRMVVSPAEPVPTQVSRKIATSGRGAAAQSSKKPAALPR